MDITNIIVEYRNIQDEIHRLERKIDELEALAASPRVSALTGMPRGGKKTDLSDIVSKIADLREMYYENLGRLLDMQAAAERAIKQIEDREERVIIGYKYIDGLSSQDIAGNVSWSRATIDRRIKSAMEHIKEREKHGTSI